MAERPDVVHRRDVAGERIVLRHRAILAQAQDLPEGLVEVLCEHALLFREVLAGGDEDMARAVRHDPAAVVVGRTGSRRLKEDVLHLGQRRHVLRQDAARCGGRGEVVEHRLGVCEEHHPVLGEARAEGHVEKAALALGQHLGHAGDRLRAPRPRPPHGEAAPDVR